MKPEREFGIIVADVREKNEALLACADRRELLRVVNPNSPSPWSYDVNITTKAGETFKFEVKWNPSDCVASWLEREGEHSRLTRQISYVDALLVVWSDMEAMMTLPEEHRIPAKGFRTWLATKQLEAAFGGPAVIVFGSEDDAIRWLLHLRDRKTTIRKAGAAPLDGSLTA